MQPRDILALIPTHGITGFVRFYVGCMLAFNLGVAVLCLVLDPAYFDHHSVYQGIGMVLVVCTMFTCAIALPMLIVAGILFIVVGGLNA